MTGIRRAAILSSLPLLFSAAPSALAQQASTKPYQVEWVYRARYGFQNEWWRLLEVPDRGAR